MLVWLLRFFVIYSQFVGKGVLTSIAEVEVYLEIPVLTMLPAKCIAYN